MADQSTKNYRFLNMDQSGGAPKKKKSVPTAPIARSSPPTPVSNTLKQTSSTTMIIASDIESLIEQMKSFQNTLESKMIAPTYKSEKFPGIEYIPGDHTVLIHDTNRKGYIFGGTLYTDKPLDEMTKFVNENNDNYWLSGRLGDDKKYVLDFCEIYAGTISRMISILGRIELLWGEVELIADINAITKDILSRFVTEDEYELPVDEQEEDDSDDDDDELDDDMKFLDREFCPDIEQEIDQEDANVDTSNIPQLDSEMSATSSSNLRKYADEIDNKIPDDDALDVIRRAREARGNRAYQREYSPQR